MNYCDVSIGQKVQNDRNAIERCARSGAKKHITKKHITKASNAFHKHSTLITMV